MKITDKRLLIIDSNGDKYSEPIVIGRQHQEIIDDYAKQKGYDYSNVEYVTKKGNVIFYNVNHNYFATYMPEKLTDEQLYQLELLDMSDIKDMEVRKFLPNNEHKDFSLEGSISKDFSEKIIQSYYGSKKASR